MLTSYCLTGKVSSMESRAEYQRAWRAARPDLSAANRAGTLARYAAALKVAKKHPEEFEKVLRSERKKRGLSPSARVYQPLKRSRA